MALEWVKSTIGYYRLTAIATGSADLEVMFKRADALAGELGENGFIPDAMLHTLTRKPAQAKRLANELVKAGLWDRVRGGYLIVDWAEINAEAIALLAKKKRDRDRKRAERAAARDFPPSDAVSTDGSEDSPAPRPEDSVLDYKRKSQRKNAAAAAPADSAPLGDLPPAVAILRSALEAHKLTVRWDRLTTEQLSEIEALIERHGDGPLVKDALRAYQPNKPPVFAAAWLGGWRQLRTPGDLAAVPDDPCPEPGHSGTTKHCIQCASERLAAAPKEIR